MTVAMANVGMLASTTKDLRDYGLAGAFGPIDFTRVLDADLKKMWCLLNEIGGVCSQPRFDRSGAQVKLREILSWGVQAGSNKLGCIVPKVPRDPHEVVARIANWRNACEVGALQMPAEVIARLDDALLRSAEF